MGTWWEPRDVELYKQCYSWQHDRKHGDTLMIYGLRFARLGEDHFESLTYGFYI
jgi:hypothetical protein